MQESTSSDPTHSLDTDSDKGKTTEADSSSSLDLKCKSVLVLERVFSCFFDCVVFGGVFGIEL